jgi:hypothetical protein
MVAPDAVVKLLEKGSFAATSDVIIDSVAALVT